MSRYSGTLPQFSNPFDGTGTLPPERRAALIREADRDNGGVISDLAWLLDTPGAMVRGALSGTGAINALSQDADERTDGRELLRQYGLAGEEDTWGNFLAGLGTEIALDPLSVLSGSAKALTPAGAAASKAGLLRSAPAVLSKAYVAGKELAPELAARAEDSLQALGRGRDAISATDVVGRPLIGRRAAGRFGTLQDLVDYADDPQRARQSLLDALGGDGRRLDALMGQNLSRDIGIGLPFKDPSFGINIPGGAAIQDAFDLAQDKLRWWLPGRALNALSNNAVGQALDAESQMLFQGADAARNAAMADARRESTYQAAKLFQSEPDVFTEEGNRALGRLIEKPLGNKFDVADDVWDSSHPAARAYRDWWDEQAALYPKEFTEAGLRGATFSDPFVSGYLPRQADGMLQQAGYNSPSLGRVLRTLTSDQMQRTAEMMVPGGRDAIAFELSKDPFVAGTKRLAKTDEEAAQHIAQKLYGGAPDASNLSQARQIATLLHRLPDHLIQNAPLFGQHPVASIARYVEGRAGAKATIESIYDSLAGIAATRPATLVEGGNHISLAEALNRVGARTVATDAGEAGARQQMRTRLAQRLGLNPDKVDLASISVPEDHVNRLTRVLEGYTSPQAAQELSAFFNAYTRAWKGGILSWPSRIVRDLYSGAFSNWLEGAFDLESVGAARRIAAGSAFSPEAVAFLKRIPKYAATPADDVAAQFYADLASTGLLDGSYARDARLITAGGPVQDLLVGTTPETFKGALSEIGGGWGSHLREFVTPGAPTDWLNRLTDTSPIIRAGAKAGNLSDKINRLTGYLSLLKQGVSPAEAAVRMKRAHVDYSSLTPIERQIRDNLFPFYAYSSRAFREVLRQMAERPGGRYGQMLRSFERLQEGEGDEYVPEELRSQFAAKIDPDNPLVGWLAAEPEVANTYFTGVDLPGLAQLGAFSGTTGNMVGNVAMGMHPAARTVYELLTGSDVWMDSPIDSVARSYGPIGKAARAISGDDNAGSGYGMVAADKLLDLVPVASRPARMLAQIYDTDSKIDLPTKVFQSAFNQSGLGRLRDVTATRARMDMIRKLREMAAPYTRDVVVPEIPKGLEHVVPQRAQDALALARELKRESRESRRRRREVFANPFE